MTVITRARVAGLRMLSNRNSEATRWKVWIALHITVRQALVRYDLVRRTPTGVELTESGRAVLELQRRYDVVARKAARA